MALQLGATRAAFLAAHGPSDLADKAAEELAVYETRFATVEGRLGPLRFAQPAHQPGHVRPPAEQLVQPERTCLRQRTASARIIGPCAHAIQRIRIQLP